jgi:CRISPR-associated endonuclease Csn1
VILIEESDVCRLMRVAKFSDGKIYLAAHNEANVDARNRDTTEGFRYLQIAPSKLSERRARIVGINILGYINDPGFAG